MQRQAKIELMPLVISKIFERFNLAEAVLAAMEASNVHVRDGDVLVISSKFVAVSEGRFVDMSKVPITSRARRLASRYSIRPALAQLVVNQSESILGGVSGFLLAINRGVLAPNAGIDLSNAPAGYAVLYPRNPDLSATRLRRSLLKLLHRKGINLSTLGIVFSDSRITPTRLGTVGVAIATSGIRPTIDLRGKKDLFGNKLKVTVRAIADQIATAAEICMGESNESTPIVLVRGVGSAFERPRTAIERSMTIAPEKCLIISGILSSARKNH